MTSTHSNPAAPAAARPPAQTATSGLAQIASGAELASAVRAPYRSYLAALALSLVIGVLLLAPSAYMFEVYGPVVNSRSESTLAWYLLAAVGIYAVLELLEGVRLRLLRGAAQQLHDRLAARVLEAGFAARQFGRPGANGQGPADLRTLADMIASPVVTGLMDLPAALGMLLLLFLINFWVGVLASVLLAALVAVGLLQERLSATPWGQAQRGASEAQLRAAEVLRNAQVVQAMAMADALHGRWAASQAQAQLRLAQASERAAATQAASRTLQLLQGSLLLGLAVWAGLRGELAGGAGMAIVASILGGRALAPVLQLAGQWRAIGSAQIAAQRLQELLRHSPPQPPGLVLPPPSQRLIAEDIAVAAPGGAALLLRQVKLGCAAGQMVAVIGPSGGGKSTLARALVGLWPTHAGKVRLDGADVAGWHKSQLGPHIGYLPQTVELLDGTLAENIVRFGRADEAALQRALDDAGIAALVANLPAGLQTRVGEGGVQLSGGERQRVALARAIYGDVRLLVLDEPDASLDQDGERALQAMLQTMKTRGAMIVVITHRPHLLALADSVMVLNNGSTLRFGPREEVLAALKAPPQPRTLARGPAAAPGSGAAATVAATPGSALPGQVEPPPGGLAPA